MFCFIVLCFFVVVILFFVPMSGEIEILGSKTECLREPEEEIVRELYKFEVVQLCLLKWSLYFHVLLCNLKAL